MLSSNSEKHLKHFREALYGFSVWESHVHRETQKQFNKILQANFLLQQAGKKELEMHSEQTRVCL
jgi:hypothetical protein